MYFESGYLYHIYNQGNNRNPIFFQPENYLFFLKKMREHLLPFTDILAWCLMPNHFHWLCYVKSVELESRADAAESRAGSKPALDSTAGASLDSTAGATPDLNNSIGILLRSYTRAINKQENMSGSLFRQTTKAINLNKIEGITPAWFTTFGITNIRVNIPEKEYPNVCYHYILQNPVRAGLAKHIEDWEFSSARDILGLRHGKLINKERIKEFNLTLSEGLT